MGWNDVRVSLIPSGRRMAAQADPKARTWSGLPLLILDIEPEPGPVPPHLDLRALRDFLDSAGFRVAQEGVWGITMARGEVEVSLVCEAAALKEAILTFMLDWESPGRLVAWEELVATMNRAFALRLVDCRTLEPVEFHNFRRLITSTPHWGDFAERWAWPSPEHFAAAGQLESGEST